MTMGDRIKQLRKQKGITQTELAKAVHTTKQTIFKYETGVVTNIPLHRLQMIADYFGVTSAYLIEANDDSKKLIDTFPNRLKEAMHGRSVTSLASDAGVSKQTISAYLGGTRKPKRLMLAELARILNVSEMWLAGYDVAKVDEELTMFVERLKSARSQSGMSQKEVAEKLFISQQAYAKYEVGTASPNPETLSKIAQLLGVSTDYLVGNEMSEPGKTVEKMFPQILSSLRKNAGISRKQFASDFYCGLSTVTMWELGQRTPDLDTLSKIAEYFNVSLDTLAGRNNSQSPSPLPNTRIRELRLQKGISQTQLSEILGIAQNTLSYWEQGRYDIDLKHL